MNQETLPGLRSRRASEERATRAAFVVDGVVGFAKGLLAGEADAGAQLVAAGRLVRQAGAVEARAARPCVASVSGGMVTLLAVVSGVSVGVSGDARGGDCRRPRSPRWLPWQWHRLPVPRAKQLEGSWRSSRRRKCVQRKVTRRTRANKPRGRRKGLRWKA